MAGYAVAHLDEIDELADGRCHYRPIRHHLGITAFGATAWTAHAAGDLVIAEHDEGDPTADQELFLVLRGHAVFELDGDRVDAPAGTLVFAPPRLRRTAYAEEAGTTIIALEGTPGAAYEARGWELWAPLVPLYEAGEYAAVADRLRVVVEAAPQYAMLFYTSPAVRVSPAGRRKRSTTSGTRSRCRRSSGMQQRKIRTWTRSAMNQRSSS